MLNVQNGCEDTVPEPILFNSWKHHIGAIRQRIAKSAAQGEQGLELLPRHLLVIGADQTDLYLGQLSVTEIGEEVIRQLRLGNHLQPNAYRLWIESNGGYRTLVFEQDQSRWVCRFGLLEDRYVHIHPGRWSPQARRVRANVLKTAILVNAYALAHQAGTPDVEMVNHVRTTYLDLSPIPRLDGSQGLLPVIELLR